MGGKRGERIDNEPKKGRAIGRREKIIHLELFFCGYITNRDMMSQEADSGNIVHTFHFTVWSFIYSIVYSASYHPLFRLVPYTGYRMKQSFE